MGCLPRAPSPRSYREQNRLLLATGHAPAFPERPLADLELAPVRDALDLVLTMHEPYPAVVIDRAWNFVAANLSMLALTTSIDVDPELLEPPINILRLGLHPRGLAPLMVNLCDWRAHFRERIERQAALTGDGGLDALSDEIARYSVPEHDSDVGWGAGEVLGPLKMRAPDGGVLAFFGMFATFDTPFEVTTSELAIELLFPADQTTADVLSARAQGRRRAPDQHFS